MLPINHPNQSGDPRLSGVEPLAVAPKIVCVMLDCGLTHVYELINAGELESYKDGRSRKITTRSIRARVERLAAAAKASKAA